VKAKKIKNNTSEITTAILNSYSQVFFSVNKFFAVIILLVTFIDIGAGIAGLLAVITSIFTGYILGFDKDHIRKGYYGFNTLLVGLGLGIWFQPGILFYTVVIFASIFTFFVCLTLQGVIGKYALPYLSLPFLFGIWASMLAAREFQALGISDRGIYTLNDLYAIGGNTLIEIYNYWNNLDISRSLRVYFLSLAAIFFQYNLLAGIAIAAGLLIYSRIGFSLSLIGFYSAYIFYQIIGANITEVTYSYIGFNYILTSIAIGGFYIIPGRNSYLWVVLIIPIVAMLTISLSSVLAVFQLPVYSLPFNIAVLLFLYALKFRTSGHKGLSEVILQQNSPESNLYQYKNEAGRFGSHHLTRIQLPFYGTWTVSQAHNGEYTHQKEWRHAWDFVIIDDDNKQYKNRGNNLSDYYCYDKAVLSPAGGIIEELIDEIDDNLPGDVNLRQNWGNTIVIKHHDFLFSKLSHLKPGSVKVSKGDHVKQGQVLASAGNSGRSPYPHLHFQLQSTPHIGSKTLDYPISYYILHKNDGYEFRSFSRPQKNDNVSAIKSNRLLTRSFDLIPGQELKFSVEEDDQTRGLTWEVKTSIYNQSFLYCRDTGSKAYFVNDGHVFYFTHFEGKRFSLLYSFYLAAFKIQKGYYDQLIITDYFPLNRTFNWKSLFFQDFFAPFFLFLKAAYKIKYVNIDNDISPSEIILESECEKFLFGIKTSTLQFSLTLDTKGIKKFSVKHKNKKRIATCID